MLPSFPSRLDHGCTLILTAGKPTQHADLHGRRLPGEGVGPATIEIYSIGWTHVDALAGRPNR